MALTNAQRQARYRARLKASASLDALGRRAGEAVDEALSVIWEFFNRPSPGGARWADIDGCETLADYRAALATDPGALVETCRQLVTYSVGLKPEEARVLQVIVDMADALALVRDRQDRYART